MSGNPVICTVYSLNREKPQTLDGANTGASDAPIFNKAMCIDFIAGCIGGSAGVLVGHPLDTVKVHMQTQDPLKPVYKGTLHCVMTIFRQDGFHGLYRGISSPMMGIGFVNAIVFGVYGNVQRYTTNPDALSSHFLAGSLAGFAQSIVCAPMELAKTRLQLQHDNYKGVRHKGPIDCLHHIVRHEGLRAGFKGLGITAARDVPGFSSYFVSYEFMIHLASNPNAVHTLMAGGLAGICSWLACYPIDVVKTCLQADGMTSAPEYKGLVDCVQKNYKKYGAQFFFRGLNSTLVRAFPMNAACFFVVSWILGWAKTAVPDLMVPTSETLATVTMGTATTVYTNLHLHERRKKELDRKRSLMLRSLKALGAFHEAVCNSELEDLANEFYPDTDDNKYYILEDERLSLEPPHDT